MKKSIVAIYGEEIEVDGKQYIIGTRFFPVSKESATVLLVKNAKKYLETVTEAKAFRAFGADKDGYKLGDLTVFVYGLDGVCYADGLNAGCIWRPMMNEKDDDGRLYVKTMIDMGKTGPTKVILKKYGARMVAYVEPVTKGNKTFIVGSGFYV